MLRAAANAVAGEDCKTIENLMHINETYEQSEDDREAMKVLLVTLHQMADE